MTSDLDSEVAALLKHLLAVDESDRELVFRDLRMATRKTTFIDKELPPKIQDDFAKLGKEIRDRQSLITSSQDAVLDKFEQAIGSSGKLSDLLPIMVQQDPIESAVADRFAYLASTLEETLSQNQQVKPVTNHHTITVPFDADLDTFAATKLFKDWLAKQELQSLAEIILSDSENETDASVIWHILATDPDLQNVQYYISDHSEGANIGFLPVLIAFWNVNHFSCSISPKGFISVDSEFGEICLPWVIFSKLFLSPGEFYDSWADGDNSYIERLTSEIEGPFLRNLKTVDDALRDAIQSGFDVYAHCAKSWLKDSLLDFFPNPLNLPAQKTPEFFAFPALKSLYLTCALEQRFKNPFLVPHQLIDLIAFDNDENELDDFEETNWELFQQTIKEVYDGGFIELVEFYIVARVSLWLPFERGYQLDWRTFFEWLNNSLIHASTKNYLAVLASSVIPIESPSYPFAVALKESNQNTNEWSNRLQAFAKQRTTEFLGNISVNEFSQREIETHFKLIGLSDPKIMSPANMLMPLFRAAEDEMKTFLSSDIDQPSTNTNYSTLLNHLKATLFERQLSAEQQTYWNKVKRQAFKIVKTRNKCAHAAIVDAEDVIPVQNAISELIRFLHQIR